MTEVGFESLDKSDCCELVWNEPTDCVLKQPATQWRSQYLNVERALEELRVGLEISPLENAPFRA